MGAVRGNITDVMTIMRIIVNASRKPGRKPPMYSRPMDSSTSTPKMIRPMLGGIRMPRVPPAAREPMTRRSLYPRCRKDGSETRLMVAEVATLEPEHAANTAQEAMLVCSSPPGRNTSQRESAPYIRSPMPERSISSPISRKRGTATRMKLVLLSHALFPRMFHSGASENACIITRDSTPSAPAT